MQAEVRFRPNCSALNRLRLGTVSLGVERVNQDQRAIAIRNLVRYQYYRNRHLTCVNDDEDLFQEAWLHFCSAGDLSDSLSRHRSGESTGADHAEKHEDDPHGRIRRAVRRATDTIFGRLRKRKQRGAPTECSLDLDPEGTCPDPDLVLDLAGEIERLPADQQAVIDLLRRGFDGHEIAAALDLSPQAVSRRKSRAIETLRRKLDAVS